MAVSFHLPHYEHVHALWFQSLISADEAPRTWAEMKEKSMGWSQNWCSSSYLGGVKPKFQGVASDQMQISIPNFQSLTKCPGGGVEPNTVSCN